MIARRMTTVPPATVMLMPIAMSERETTTAKPVFRSLATKSVDLKTTIIAVTITKMKVGTMLAATILFIRGALTPKSPFPITSLMPDRVKRNIPLREEGKAMRRTSVFPLGPCANPKPKDL